VEVRALEEVLAMASHPSETHLVGVGWMTWVVLALLMLPILDGPAYGAVVAISAVVIAVIPGAVPRTTRAGDHQDLLVVAASYVAVVALMRLAFVGFTTDNTLGMFLSFACALVLGAAGPVVYTSWVRRRPLSTLGLQVGDLRRTVSLALLFGGVQFALTLWGYDLPAPVDWVPLLVMALVVGVFESIFFRGFIQNRLEEQYGTAIGVGGAAILYGLYHVGYGMGPDELLFLTGLGVAYGVAFSLARSLLVLWPLLTPLGSLFAQLEAGDIELPWASIMGFADVFAAILAVIWLAHRHETRLAHGSSDEPLPLEVSDR
jgi:membrane protease YdiL (CAAX protease family)